MKPNFRLCLLAALLAAASSNHAQEVLLHHQGATDPVSEGFSLVLTPHGFVGPTNNLGHDAWWVFSGGDVVAYRYLFSAAEQRRLERADAILAVTMRIQGFPNTAHTAAMAFYHGNEAFWIGLDMQADGDPLIRTRSSLAPIWAYEGGGSGYHDYEFRYHADTDTASLWVDGLERVNDINGDPGFAGWGVFWGSPGQGLAGSSYWNDVSLTVIPEPSSLAVAGLGVLCLCGRLLRDRRPISTDG
jgi:hypothetical protein